MRDKVRQSTIFRYVQERQFKSIIFQRNKSEARCLLGLEHYVKILPLIKKKTVNNVVLSLNFNLFRTKVDIKSVIRDLFT